MHNRMRFSGTARLLALLAVLLLTCGCARNVANLQTWRPPVTPVEGVENLAVLPLAGPVEISGPARDALQVELAAGGMYTMNDSQRVASISAEGLYRADGRVNRDSAAALGRQLGADAVLVGRVTFEDGRGRPRGSTQFQMSISKTVAVLDYQIIDARTADVRFEERTTDSYFGEFATGKKSADSEINILKRLALGAAKKAGGQLAPHLETTEVRLASATLGAGASKIRQGNQLARDGKWREAQAIWEVAAVDNPENHAALYNLGLAHEAQGEYAEASTYFQRAQRIGNRDTYEAALARCVASAADHETIAAQLQQRDIAARHMLQLGEVCYLANLNPRPAGYEGIAVSAELIPLPPVERARQ